MDFGRHMEVASLEATEEIMAVASFPQAPYVSTTIGTHTHPRSEHLGSLAWCFLDSVAWPAAVADTYGGPGGRATKHCTTLDFAIEQYSNGPVRFRDRTTTIQFRYRTTVHFCNDLFLQSNSDPFLQ